MDCFHRIKAYLRHHRVAFDAQHHPIAYTAQEVAASEHLPSQQMAKVVMVVADGKLAMLVLPASRRVDEERAAAALNATTVRLAREEEFASTFADCDVGAMPPFGTLYGVPVYVDDGLAEHEGRLAHLDDHAEVRRLRAPGRADDGGSRAPPTRSARLRAEAE
jgi:Ala-tRNA(Pro) deacylase